MDCPVCKSAMITMELTEVEIDHCLDCGGIWLDAGELEEFGPADPIDELAHPLVLSGVFDPDFNDVPHGVDHLPDRRTAPQWCRGMGFLEGFRRHAPAW